jgi:hypothetical protein
MEASCSGGLRLPSGSQSGNDGGESTDKRLTSILEAASGLRSDQQIERTAELVRLTYELPEEYTARPKADYRSISGYVISAAGHVQISAYFNTPNARTLGYKVIHTVQHA